MELVPNIASFKARHPDLRAAGVVWPMAGLFVLLMGGVAAITIAALNGWMPLWAGTILNATLLYFTAHINHEAFHRNISSAHHEMKWLDDSIGHIVSFIFWFSFPAFKAMHLAHHRQLNDPENDSDMWVARRNPLMVVLACFTLLFRYEFDMWRLYRAGRWDKDILIQFYLERLLAVGLVIAAFQFGYGREVVMLWLVPALGILPLIVLFFTVFVHHPHKEQDDIQGTNVILAPGWLLPFVTLIFVFQNYHLIHHLYPRVPFYRLGEVFRRLRPQLEANGAIVKTILK